VFTAQKTDNSAILKTLTPQEAVESAICKDVRGVISAVKA